MLFIIFKEQALSFLNLLYLKSQKIICHGFKHSTLFYFFKSLLKSLILYSRCAYIYIILFHA